MYNAASNPWQQQQQQQAPPPQQFQPQQQQYQQQPQQQYQQQPQQQQQAPSYPSSSSYSAPPSHSSLPPQQPANVWQQTSNGPPTPQPQQPQRQYGTNTNSTANTYGASASAGAMSAPDGNMWQQPAPTNTQAYSPQSNMQSYAPPPAQAAQQQTMMHQQTAAYSSHQAPAPPMGASYGASHNSMSSVPMSRPPPGGPSSFPTGGSSSTSGGASFVPTGTGSTNTASADMSRSHRPPAAPSSGQANKRSSYPPASASSSAAASAVAAGPSAAAPAAPSSSATNAATPAQLAAMNRQLNSVPPGYPWTMSALASGSAGSSMSAVEAAPTTLFGNDQFTEEESARIQLLLERRLASEEMSTRSGGGKAKLYYVESHSVINFANYIFDYNGWSSSIKEFTTDFAEEKGGRWFVGLSCIVRIMLKDGTYHEDIGYGSCANMPDRAAALEKAKKEAASDALKRALRLFGNGLGNCIYDKEYLSKLGKGQVISAPLDLSLNRPRKRQRFMPMTKEEIRQQEAQQTAAAHAAQATTTMHAMTTTGSAAHTYPPSGASAQVSPKTSKSHAYAAAAAAVHQQQQASALAPGPANPYMKTPQQQQQQAQPQPPPQQWNSPIVKAEMSSPVPTAHHRPPAMHASASGARTNPAQTPTNSWQNPSAPTNANTNTTTAPTMTSTTNPWQPSTTLPLQSNYAQQVLMTPQQTNATPQVQNSHTSYTPQAPQQQQQQQAQSHPPPSSRLSPPSPRPHSARPGVPLSSFSASAHVPVAAAAPLTESKVDNDLDDDLLIDIADRHSPQKPDHPRPGSGSAGSHGGAGGGPSVVGVQRQLRLDESKENRPPSKPSSLHSSPAPSSHPSQNTRTSPQPQPQAATATAAPTKSPIFSVEDLLQDHEQMHA